MLKGSREEKGQTRRGQARGKGKGSHVPVRPQYLGVRVDRPDPPLGGGKVVLRGRQVGLVQQDEVGIGDLLLGLVRDACRRGGGRGRGRTLHERFTLCIDTVL